MTKVMALVQVKETASPDPCDDCHFNEFDAVCPSAYDGNFLDCQHHNCIYQLKQIEVKEDD